MEDYFIFYGLSKTKTKTSSFANTFLETYRTSQQVFVGIARVDSVGWAPAAIFPEPWPQMVNILLPLFSM